MWQHDAGSLVQCGMQHVRVVMLRKTSEELRGGWMVGLETHFWNEEVCKWCHQVGICICICFLR